MTTNAALAFCSDAWWGLILNVFWGPQGAQILLWGQGGPRPPPCPHLEPPLLTQLMSVIPTDSEFSL